MCAHEYFGSRIRKFLGVFLYGHVLLISAVKLFNYDCGSIQNLVVRSPFLPYFSCSFSSCPPVDLKACTLGVVNCAFLRGRFFLSCVFLKIFQLSDLFSKVHTTKAVRAVSNVFYFIPRIGTATSTALCHFSLGS